MEELDKRRPYSIVCGAGPARFEQDGKLFKGDFTLLSDGFIYDEPEQTEQPRRRRKAFKD